MRCGRIRIFAILIPAPAVSEESAYAAGTLAIKPRWPVRSPGDRSFLSDPLRGRSSFVLEGDIMTSVIIHSGFRGLRYIDGRFDEVLSPGRYRLPRRRFPFQRVPRVEVTHVDVREREL